MRQLKTRGGESEGERPLCVSLTHSGRGVELTRMCAPGQRLCLAPVLPKGRGTRAVPMGLLGPRRDRGAWIWLMDASSGTVPSNYLVKPVGRVDKMENGFFFQGSGNHKVTSGLQSQLFARDPGGLPEGA